MKGAVLPEHDPCMDLTPANRAAVIRGIWTVNELED